MWLKAATKLIFPPPIQCPLCLVKPVSITQPACKECVSQLGFYWQRVKISNYQCFTISSYQGKCRELLHDIKYKRNYEAAQCLGVIAGMAIREEPALARINWLLPVPLHPSRMQQRGFNQAHVFAEGIIRGWKRPILSGVVRIKNTQPQSGLTPIQRHQNLSGAFAFQNPGLVQKKQVLIVDDIFTTGTTFQVLARLIKGYGGTPLGIFIAKG